MAGKGIILNVFRIPFRAGVAKSVDAVDSKSTVEIRAGSSPAFGTIGMLIKSPKGGFFCAKFQQLSLFYHLSHPYLMGYELYNSSNFGHISI